MTEKHRREQNELLSYFNNISVIQLKLVTRAIYSKMTETLQQDKIITGIKPESLKLQDSLAGC